MAEEDVEIDPNVLYQNVPPFVPGERCQTDPGGRNAWVMYIGKPLGLPGGYWVGVQYDEKVGKNDGTVNGRRYFRCPPGHGGFLRPPKVKKMSDVAEAQKLEEEKKAEALRARTKGTGPDEDSPGTELGSAAADAEGTSAAPSGTARPRSPSRRRMSLDAWQRDIGTIRGTKGVATPDGSYATGTGLTVRERPEPFCRPSALPSCAVVCTRCSRKHTHLPLIIACIRVRSQRLSVL
jgi:hypothetical protein